MENHNLFTVKVFENIPIKTICWQQKFQERVTTVTRLHLTALHHATLLKTYHTTSPRPTKLQFPMQ